MVPSLLRLWSITFAFNLVGGVLFLAVFIVEGVLPPGSADALSTAAEEIAGRRAVAGFASAIVGGALVSLLSFLLQGVNTASSRTTLAFVVGFLLALGPFDHVVVTALHVFVGMLFDADVSSWAFTQITAVATTRNLVGGLGLVTLAHVAQAIGAEESAE